MVFTTPYKIPNFLLVLVSPNSYISKIIYSFVFAGFFLFPRSSFLGASLAPLLPSTTSVLASEVTTDNIARISVRIDRLSGYGSGVIVDRNGNDFYVLTNAHVVDNPEPYRIVTADGVSHEVRSKVMLDNMDLALVTFTSDRNYAVAAIEREVSVPMKIQVGGWSRSGGSLAQPVFVTTAGNLTAIDSNLPLGYALTYSNLVRAGMSGGGIFNAAGKLVGINGVVRLNGDCIVASGIPIARYWQWKKQQPNLMSLEGNTQSDRSSTVNNSTDYVLAKTLSAPAAVNSLAVNLDGTIITGSSDGTISIWQRGRAIARWQDGTSINAIAIAPNGRILASAGDDGTISIWNLTDRILVRRLKRHKGAITDLVFSPDGNLISSSWDKTVRLWQPKTGRLIDTLAGHSQIVNAIALSRDGKILASGSQDRTIRLWDLTTGKSIHTFEGHSLGVVSLAISPDGKILASGSGDGTIKLWDLATNKLIKTLAGHTDGVWSLAVASNNQTLFSGSWDKTIKVWNLNTGSLQQTLQHQDYLATLALNFRDHTVISGDFQGKIYIWRVKLLGQLRH
jgi:hypothetical protein